MEKKHSIKDLISALKKKKFLIVFLFGMSAGLPLMLVASSLKIWLRRSDIDLTSVAMISWLMVPYSFISYFIISANVGRFLITVN